MRALNTLNSQLRGSRRHGEEEDQEGWLVSYADLITLLFVLFSLLLSISVVSKTKFERMSQQLNEHATSSLSELARQLEAEIDQEKLQAQVQTRLTDEGLQIQFNERVLFASATAELNADGLRVLASFSRLLAGRDQNFHLAVEGYTDDQPIHTAAFSSNWALSAARSVTVVHFLAAHGISEKALMVRAFADTRPVDAASKKESSDFRAQNRRVTLLVY